MPKKKKEELIKKEEEVKEEPQKITLNLANALSTIEKQFGKGTITKLNSKDKVEIEVISTGSMALNNAIGVGGIPQGRIIEIFGQETTGKSTLCLSIISEFQKTKGIAAFIDAEQVFDVNYAKKLKVNVDDLLFCQPDCGEQGLTVAETLVESGEVGLIVIDSVAALTPRAEIEGDIGDSHMGLQARLMSQAMRKLAATIRKTNTTIIFTNQLRSKIGVMFGSPWVTCGGNALKYYSSLRIELSRVGTVNMGEEKVASEIKAKIVKNKVAAPYKEAKFEIYFDEGLSRLSDIIMLSLDYKILTKSGSWISYDNNNLCQGIEQLRNLLKEDPILLEDLRTRIVECIKN
jgi:recombination protein RecA